MFRNLMRNFLKMSSIIVVISLSLPLLAEIPDSIYFEANELYQEGKYEDAIEKYQLIIRQGYESADLYYNTGNAFFRSNKLGNSRLYYEKALKLDPNDKDIMANLAFVENLLVDKFEDIPELFLKRWLNSLIRLLGSDQWGLISIFAFISAFISFSIYLLVNKILLRKSGFYTGIAMSIIAVFSFIFSWKQRNLEVIPETAVVIEYLINVKSAPRDSGTDLFVLHEGAKVWLEDAATGWQEIRLSDGRKGWVPSAVLGII